MPGASSASPERPRVPPALILGTRSPSRYNRAVRPIVLLLGFAGFVAIAVMRVADPLLPMLSEEFAVSLGGAGLIVTAYSLPYGLFVLVYGPLGDRFGKLRVIILSMGLSALCIFMCGFADSLAQLIFWRFLTGITCAATVPLSLAFIGDHYPIAERQKALARYMSGVILGQIFGAGLGGLFADVAGWRNLFRGYGVLTACAALAVWYGARRLAMPPQVVIGLRGTVARYLSVLRHPAGREVMLAVFIEGFLLFGGTAFLGALLHDQYGLSLTRVGGMLVCVGLGSLVYTASVGWLMRRFGQRAMIAAGGILMFGCLATLAHTRMALIAAPALLLLGLAIYLMHNTLQMLATELAPEARGTSVSLMAFMLFAGQAAGAFCLGVAIDRIGYATSYTALAVALVLLGAWLQGTRAVRRGPLAR